MDNEKAFECCEVTFEYLRCLNYKVQKYERSVLSTYCIRHESYQIRFLSGTVCSHFTLFVVLSFSACCTSDIESSIKGATGL